MKSVFYSSLLIVLMLAIFACRNPATFTTQPGSNVPAEYVPAAKAVTQGQPLAFGVKHPETLIASTCRVHDRDDGEEAECQQLKHHLAIPHDARFCNHKSHKEGQFCHADNDDKGIVICHVPPGNPANARTLCVDYHGLLGHLKHPYDYLGVCGAPSPSPSASPVVLPSPSASPIVVPSPSASPIVVPSPSPSPIVLPSPSPSPIILPSPSPSPIILPSPSPSPFGG